MEAKKAKIKEKSENDLSLVDIEILKLKFRSSDALLFTTSIDFFALFSALGSPKNLNLALTSGVEFAWVLNEIDLSFSNLFY